MTTPLAAAAIARARTALDVATASAARPLADFPIHDTITARLAGRDLPWAAERMHNEYTERGFVTDRGGILVDPRVFFGRALLFSPSGSNLVATGVDSLVSSEELGVTPAVVRAGATMLSGLEGNSKVPTISSSGSASWVSTETGAPSQDSAVFAQYDLAPKQVTAWVDVSRLLRRTSGVNIDRLIAGYFGRAMARAIDRAALVGDPVATPGSPRGIAQTSGVGSVVMGPNGGPLTRARLREFFEDVALSNGIRPASRYAFAINAATAGYCYATETASGSGRYLFEPEGNDASVGKLGGYPAVITNNLPANGTKGTSSGICSTVICGDFTELTLATWGPIEIVIDPYKNASRGAVRIVALWSVDIGIAHPAAFTVATDVTTP
jgi:HK97 family phage major capsid protein